MSVPLPVKELSNTYGVLFIGYIMGMVVYGFTCFQTYVYYSRYPLDHWAIKATVGSLCLMDTINSALISHALYFYLILSFPNTPALLHVTRTYCAEIGVSVIAILVVQIYYSYRVWIASQNAAVAAGIAVISLSAFALGMTATVNLAKNLVFTSLTTPQAKSIMASSQGLTFLSGLVTFAALSFYLGLSQNPMVKSTKKLYNIVVEYPVTRGGLATAAQFSYFVVFISMPSKSLWMAFHLVTSGVFINSLLAMLNVREIHRGQGVNEEDIISRQTNTTSSTSTPQLNSNGIRFAPRDNATRESKTGINIQVTRKTENGTTSKLLLHDEEADGWDRKRASN